MRIEKIMRSLALFAPAKKDRPMSTHHHIAIIILRGKIISFATNKCRTRSRTPNSAGFTIHAERNAIYKLGDHSKMKGAIMLVIRVLSDGSLGESKPCHSCEQHLKKCMEEYGLSKVFYSCGFHAL
jgi:cytidine deaminase